MENEKIVTGQVELDLAGNPMILLPDGVVPNIKEYGTVARAVKGGQILIAAGFLVSVGLAYALITRFSEGDWNPYLMGFITTLYVLVQFAVTKMLKKVSNLIRDRNEKRETINSLIQLETLGVRIYSSDKMGRVYHTIFQEKGIQICKTPVHPDLVDQMTTMEQN